MRPRSLARPPQIKVRLRKSANGGFYHYEHILGTLLHELCHSRRRALGRLLQAPR